MRIRVGKFLLVVFLVLLPVQILFAEEKIKFLADQEFYPVLMQKLTDAEKSIHISMYLFKVTDNPANPVRHIVKALTRARNKGVSVFVLLERSPFNKSLNKENRRIMKTLAKSGVQVKWDSKKVQTHTKLIVVDALWTFIGSHNFSYSALKKNHEVTLLVRSRELAERSISYFREISQY